MDFAKTTAEELFASLPANEDDHWEFKSALLLDPKNKGELKKELGKQISAFANSGGGNIVFGITEKPRGIEACPEKVSRQSMQDFLSTMVEQSVDYPLRSFQIHQIPFADTSKGSIFLIHIDDSVAAPHQAKDERQYYYRISGHSKPAPHFHIELLRSRQTKCIVESKIGAFKWNLPWLPLKERKFTCNISIIVKNLASFVASPIGLAIRPSFPAAHWLINGVTENDAEVVQVSKEFLFPGQSTAFDMQLTCQVKKEESLVEIVCRELNKVSLQIQAFTQNYGSPELKFNLADLLTVEAVSERESGNELEREKFKAKGKKLAEELKPKLQAALDDCRRATDKLAVPKNFN